MSAQTVSRALQEGRVKALRRMKQALAPEASGLSDASGHGIHIPTRSAQRRADRVTLQKLLRDRQRWDE